MAERLAKYAPVLYVDPAISPLAPRRNPSLVAALEKPRLRLIGPSLARVTPVSLPFAQRPGIRLFSAAVTRHVVRQAVRNLDASVHAIVIASLEPLFNAAGSRAGHGALKVLYGTDDFVAGAALMGQPVRCLRRSETRRLAEASFAVAVSEKLADHWRRMGADVIFIPNGVDEELFSRTDEVAPASDVQLASPIAGFIGHLSERIDLRYLEAVADRGHSLLLVGPRQGTFEMSAARELLARPNVQWVGAKPFASLPSYMRMIDVGLVPYADSAFNRASFPLKTLEYLAGGRQVVSTSLPSVRWLETDLVRIADDPAGFAETVGVALGEDRPQSLISRRKAFAAGHSWSARAERFAEVLGLLNA